jgi:hypothetical protein
MATNPNAGQVTGPRVEKPVVPDPSGLPVPAVVFAYFTDEAAAPALFDVGGGGELEPELERVHLATIIGALRLLLWHAAAVLTALLSLPNKPRLLVVVGRSIIIY